jgi:hypothetical protein
MPKCGMCNFLIRECVAGSEYVQANGAQSPSLSERAWLHHSLRRLSETPGIPYCTGPIACGTQYRILTGINVPPHSSCLSILRPFSGHSDSRRLASAEGRWWQPRRHKQCALLARRSVFSGHSPAILRRPDTIAGTWTLVDLSPRNRSRSTRSKPKGQIRI